MKCFSTLLVFLAFASFGFSAESGERVIFKEGKVAGEQNSFATVEFEKRSTLEINFKGWGSFLAVKEHDWTGFDAIKLEMYSARADKESMVIALASEPEQKKAGGNYYSCRLSVNWSGWRTVILPFKRFDKSRSPIGWSEIQKITFHTRGYNLKPEEGACVRIGSISLLPGTPPDPNTGLKPCLYPINTAESVMSVFWDSTLSDYRYWKAEQGKASQTGWHLEVSWTDSLRLTRELELDCARFDRIVPAIGLTPGVEVVVEAETDLGVLQRKYKVPNDGGKTSEFPLSIKGSKLLKRITLSIKNAKGGNGTGFFRYVILTDSEELKKVDRMYADIAKIDFDKYVVSDKYFSPTFIPGLNVFCDNDKLQSIREEILGNPELKQQLESQRTYLKSWKAQKNIRAYTTQDRRFARDRDLAAQGVYDLTRPAWCGTLLHDTELTRLAAKRAIALVLMPHWGAGMMASMPGTKFEHRCFDESNAMCNLAFVLDFCYEMFTPYGRELILRTLAERGTGTANFNAWRHKYIYYNNQLSAFSEARIASYLVMEKSNWQNVKPYTDLAIAELNESMGNILESDGGYLEGSSYYQYTLAGGLCAYYLYARARGKAFHEVLPIQLKRAPDYIELMMSTDQKQGFVPLNDGGSSIYVQVAQMLANMYPESQLGRLCNKSCKLSGPVSVVDYWSFLCGSPSMDKKEIALRPFVKIDSICSVSSVRALAGEVEKLFVTGDARSGGHKHRDAGSFILEYAGETYAMDSGICSYALPFSKELKKEERHNVMVPVLANGSYPQQRWIPESLKYTASGDEKRFEFTVDLAPCWNNMFKTRERSIVSNTPEEIILTDTFEVADECVGVKFFYLSPLPITVNDRVVTVAGTKADLTFSIPDGWQFVMEKLSRELASDQFRLTLSSTARQGQLQLNLRLIPRKNK